MWRLNILHEDETCSNLNLAEPICKTTQLWNRGNFNFQLSRCNKKRKVQWFLHYQLLPTLDEFSDFSIGQIEFLETRKQQVCELTPPLKMKDGFARYVAKIGTYISFFYGRLGRRHSNFLIILCQSWTIWLGSIAFLLLLHVLMSISFQNGYQLFLAIILNFLQ